MAVLQQVNGGIDDHLGVETKVSVKISDVAGLAEVAYPEARDRHVADPRKEAECVGVPILHGHDRRATIDGEQDVEDLRLVGL